MSQTLHQIGLVKAFKTRRLLMNLKRIGYHKLGMMGILIILSLMVMAIFTPFLAPYDPYQQGIAKRLLPPSWLKGGSSEHLLGTDHLGRDLLTRIMYGSRISLIIGFSAVLLQVIIGVLLGLVAGYIQET